MLTTPLEDYKHITIQEKIFNNSTLSDIISLYKPEPRPKLISKTMEIAKDEDIKFDLIENQIEGEELKSPALCFYKYECIHPCKKVFMGPDKLNVKDEYRIILENKNLLYVEITNYLSGFMLMDTFFTRTLYTYEQTENGVKLSVRLYIEFVKACPMKTLIEKNGINQIDEAVNNIVVPELEKFLSGENLVEPKLPLIGREIKYPGWQLQKMIEPFRRLGEIISRYGILLNW